MSLDQAQNAFIKLAINDYLKSSAFKTSLKTFIDTQETIGEEGSRAFLEFRHIMRDYKEAKQLLARCSVPEVREKMMAADTISDKLLILLKHVVPEEID